MLTINVSGPAHTGKTTVSAAIANLLKENGFDVEVKLLDGETLDDITNLNERLQRVADRNETINIVETQTHRRAMND